MLWFIDGTDEDLALNSILEVVKPEDRKVLAIQYPKYSKYILDFEIKLDAAQSKRQQNILLLSEQAQQASSQKNSVKRKAVDDLEDEPAPKRIKIEEGMKVDEPESNSKRSRIFGYDCSLQ